jgi:hypothetical protein
LKLLVKAGADVTLKDVEGLTALQLALQSSHKNCVDFLQTQLVAESSDSEDSSSSSSDSESESESESDAKVKTNRAASEGFASGGKDNLLADIRKGKDLKKAPQEKKMLKQAVGRVLSSDSVTIEGSDLMVSIPALDDEGNPLPDWKLRVLHRKAADKAQKIAEIKATEDAEAARWAGVPEWKRKVLEEKEKKRLEKMAPAIAKQKAEEERLAKLAAMPEWKRQLIEKKK